MHVFYAVFSPILCRFISDNSNTDWGFEFTCLPTETRLKATSSRAGFIQCDSEQLELNRARRLSVNGYYHAAVVFDEMSEVAPDEVIEFFDTEPIGPTSTPFAIVAPAGYSIPVEGAPKCTQGHTMQSIDYREGGYRGGFW